MRRYPTALPAAVRAVPAVRPLPAERVDAAIAAQRTLARRLADAGVLVLDPQAVLEAPAGLVVRAGPDGPVSAVRP